MNRWFDNLPIIGNFIPGKIVLSFLMLLFAIFLHIFFKDSKSSFCILAMSFSFIGDIALNHKQTHDEQSNKDFIVGGISFILAHMFYCITYFQKIQINHYKLLNFGAFISVTILIAVTIFMLIKLNSNSPLVLSLFGFVYLWLTGINYISIFSYAYSVKSIESIAALGGLMFLASDVIIGLEKFLGMKSKFVRELVWWLYPIGQIIIIAIA